MKKILPWTELRYSRNVVFDIKSAHDVMDLKKNRVEFVRDLILVSALDTAAELAVRVLARVERSDTLLEQSAMAGLDFLS